MGTRPVTPALTVDIIVELTSVSGRPIVLIERRYEPLGWALPGGFVDVGETVENAAVREAKEEICLDVNLIHLLGVYSDPSRDARGHTVSIVYVGTALGQPEAADDAKNVKIWQIDQLPKNLAFDHDQILLDYKTWRTALS